MTGLKHSARVPRCDPKEALGVDQLGPQHLATLRLRDGEVVLLVDEFLEGGTLSTDDLTPQALQEVGIFAGLIFMFLIKCLFWLKLGRGSPNGELPSCIGDCRIGNQRNPHGTIALTTQDASTQNCTAQTARGLIPSDSSSWIHKC